MDISALLKNNRPGLLVFVILLVAIPLTIYLVRQTQIFKGRANFISTGMSFRTAQSQPIQEPASTAVPNIIIRLGFQPEVPPTAVPSPTNTPSLTGIPTLPPFQNASNLCTISSNSEPDIMSAGAQYRAMSNTTGSPIVCNSGVYAQPGTCLWGFLAGSAGSLPSRYFQSSMLNSSNQLNISGNDLIVGNSQQVTLNNFPAGQYWLFFFRTYGGSASLPVATCVKTVTIVGSP
ncbi:MAG: hypothetical protein CEO21_178 [Microgenomates group bacterium Gr01-1014_80]|nr:MAG: hypothetical protein CEO21_178 [Microgenomates group bacterium Gr01-1014_80]